MVQKTYFKTKDYCKVKFSYAIQDAETVKLVGLNSDWENSINMTKKKTELLPLMFHYPRIHAMSSNTW